LNDEELNISFLSQDSSLLILDMKKNELKGIYKVGENEKIYSILSNAFYCLFVDFEENSKKFIILGTSCAKDSTQFQDYGRMILLQLFETKSTFEKEVSVS
jgi:hypothetical protein